MKKMIFKMRLMICMIVAFFVVNSFAAALPTENRNSIVGYWQTIDDYTHHANSVIKIWKQNKRYFGKIDYIYPVDGQKNTDLCTECKGEFHNKLMLGLMIMKDFKKMSPGYYSKGTIMDPRSGKVYKCHLTLKDEGHRLLVRGYIGISLFGRTQTWNRISNPHLR